MKTQQKLILSLGITMAIVSPLVLAMAILRGDDPQRALGVACWKGDLLRARVALLCGADVNKHVPGTLQNIAAAGCKGNVAIIEFLLSRGANIEIKDKFGGTALSRTAQSHQVTAVECLLAHGANPNVGDKEGGNTPLDLAAMNHPLVDEPANATEENRKRVMAALEKAGGRFSTMVGRR